MALISASTLAYEILLVRVFAIEHFHHFAFMAIGVAMLGFGASGTLMSLVTPAPQRATRWFVNAALATPLALIASSALSPAIPLDAAQLPWDVRQWPWLAAVYLLLALPFAVGALAILVALTLEPRGAGHIYGASFVGAGAGAGLALAILWLLPPDRALAMPALLASLGTLLPAAVGRWGRVITGLALTVFAIAVATMGFPPWRLEVSPYKALPQIEAYPGARRLAERSSPLGWVVAVEAEAFRHAPGLSLGYTGAFPRQTALLVDGDLAGARTSWGAGRDSILDWLPSALPYALGRRARVLVIGAGDGLEVWNALVHGATQVTALELNGDLVELAGWGRAGRQAEADRRAFGYGQVEWVIGDARSYAARTRERFDLVVLGPGSGFGSAAAGVHALDEGFANTVEAYETYLRRLSADGVLAVTLWSTVPPRPSVRLVLTAVEALRRVAPAAIADGLVVARSWATTTILAKPSGFQAADIEKVSAWAEARRFDLDWHPGLGAPLARFNLVDEPTLFEAAKQATAGRESAGRFAANYPFDVAPASDARPYFHHYLRWASLPAFVGRDRGAWLPFAEWGYVALLATLAQSIVLAALLLIVPVAFAAGAVEGRGRSRLVAYFASIGFAYLLAEIAAIQQLTLLLGHPVFAVAAVLAAFLICSGVGSARSDRWAVSHGRRVALALAGALVLYSALLLTLVHALQAAPLAVRAAAAVLWLAPLAYLMGTPFPLGLRSLAEGSRSRIAWAWATNGFASVVATPLAALLALEVGTRALFLAAAAAYGAAGLLYRGSKLAA